MVQASTDVKTEIINELEIIKRDTFNFEIGIIPGLGQRDKD